MIFSDVHGNLPALELVLSHAGSVDGYVSLGDVIDFGPWSTECVKLIEQLSNCVKIKGNHEEMFLTKQIPDSKSLVSAFYHQCSQNFAQYAEIEAYQDSFELQAFTCIHTIQNRYIFPDTVVHLDNNYFVGHSHYQFLTENNGFRLYNPGSVGLNRQNLSLAQYIIYDTVSDTVEFRSCPYDGNKVIQKMIENKYPRECIEYYQSKLPVT